MTERELNQINRNRRRFQDHWKKVVSHDDVTLPNVINEESFETIEDKCGEALKRIDDLLKGGRDERKLAEILLSCRVNSPCRSCACPLCIRRERIGLIQKASELYEKAEESYVLNLVFFQDALTDKDFQYWTPDRYKKRLRAQIKRLGVSLRAFGSIEIDWFPYQERWLPHTHLLVMGQRQDIEKLRRFYLKPKNMRFDPDVVCRPMKVQPVKNPSDQFGYLFKFRMIRHEKKAGLNRKLRLTSKHHSMSLLKLNELGMQRLLFDYESKPRQSAKKIGK